MSINWPDITFPPINLWSVWMKSPCKKECNYDSKRRLCTSCGRSTEELSNWTLYTDDEREYHTKLARLRLKKLGETV